jgi:hypothetical protein
MAKRFHVLGGMLPHNIFLRFSLTPSRAARYYARKLENDARNEKNLFPLTRAVLSTCAEQKAEFLSL